MKIEKVYDLTPLQKGILFYNVLEPDSVAYFEQATLYFYENINIDLLKTSFKLIQKRYEVLRTAFYYRIANCPKQVVLDDRVLEFSYEDLQYLGVSKCEKYINKYKKADMKKGFDLEKDNLMRIKLFQESEEKYTMIWSCHHIIVDGWSNAIIINKLLSYYMRLVAGESIASILEEIKVEITQETSFSQYVSKLYSNDQEKGLQYWTRLLEGYSNIAEIPLLRSVDKSKEQIEEVEDFLSEELTDKIMEFSENMKISVSHIFEMAWGIALQHFTGLDDVVFGKLVTGRNIQISGIENIVGMLLNTIPLRVKTENNTTIGKMLNDLKIESIESSQYDYCDLSMIQKRINSKNNLIKSLYLFQNIYTDNEYHETISKIKIDSEEVADQVEYPITFTVMMIGSHIKLTLTYNPQYYLGEEMTQVMVHLKTILDEIIQSPSNKVIQIPRFDENEKTKINISGIEFYEKNFSLWYELCKKYSLDTNKLDEIQFQVLSEEGNVCGINKPGVLCIIVCDQFEDIVKNQVVKTNIRGRWNNIGQFEKIGNVENKLFSSGKERKNNKVRLGVKKDNSLEKMMCDIYKECLGIDEYHLYDDFLSKGGDSITSLKIQARLKKEKIEVALKDIFEKNINEMVETIKGMNKKKSG